MYTPPMLAHPPEESAAASTSRNKRDVSLDPTSRYSVALAFAQHAYAEPSSDYTGSPANCSVGTISSDYVNVSNAPPSTTERRGLWERQCCQSVDRDYVHSGRLVALPLSKESGCSNEATLRPFPVSLSFSYSPSPLSPQTRIPSFLSYPFERFFSA